MVVRMRMSNRIINYDVLWDRISTFAVKAGRISTRPVLILYYILASKKTSRADKMLILSTLSYLVLPIDILDAKRLPIIGWIDEIGSIGITISKVRKNIRRNIVHTEISAVFKISYGRTLAGAAHSGQK